MATHSSVLAWRIPGTGEPGGLRLWGRTESDTTEATEQQQQQHGLVAQKVKNLPFNVNLDLIPGFRKFPGEVSGHPLQSSCLENPRDGGAWWAAVYGFTQSQTQLKRLSSSSSSLL